MQTGHDRTSSLRCTSNIKGLLSKFASKQTFFSFGNPISPPLPAHISETGRVHVSVVTLLVLSVSIDSSRFPRLKIIYLWLVLIYIFVIDLWDSPLVRLQPVTLLLSKELLLCGFSQTDRARLTLPPWNRFYNKTPVDLLVRDNHRWDYMSRWNERLMCSVMLKD